MEKLGVFYQYIDWKSLTSNINSITCHLYVIGVTRYGVTVTVVWLRVDQLKNLSNGGLAGSCQLKNMMNWNDTSLAFFTKFFFSSPGNWRDLSYVFKNTNNFNIHNIANISALGVSPRFQELFSDKNWKSSLWAEKDFQVNFQPIHVTLH